MGTYKDSNDLDDLSDEEGEDEFQDDSQIKENDPDIQNQDINIDDVESNL